MSLSVTALAANNDGTNGTDIDVNAKYVDSVAAATTISVDVTWEAMEFTYTVSGTKTWDAAKHEYVISALTLGVDLTMKLLSQTTQTQP